MVLVLSLNSCETTSVPTIRYAYNSGLGDSSSIHSILDQLFLDYSVLARCESRAAESCLCLFGGQHGSHPVPNRVSAEDQEIERCIRLECLLPQSHSYHGLDGCGMCTATDTRDLAGLGLFCAPHFGCGGYGIFVFLPFPSMEKCILI